MFCGLKIERFRLRFDEEVAPLVRERSWHPSQRSRELPEGGLELTLFVGISPQVERWLLGWGEHVEVREPAALRHAMAESAARAARRHGDGGAGEAES